MTLCMLGNFSSFFCRLLHFFFKINFFKKFFLERYQSVKRFGSRSDGRYVSSDLGPNCLQRLSADDKYFTVKERVKILLLFASMSSKGLEEPVHPLSLFRAFIAIVHKVLILKQMKVQINYVAPLDNCVCVGISM